MNCSEFRAGVNARGNADEAAYRRHLGTCELCRAWYGEWRLAQALQSLPVPEPSPGFVDRALHAAAMANRQGRSRQYAAAAAVLLMVAAGLGGLFSLREYPGEDGALDVVSAEPRMVNVVIDTRRDRQDALVTIELADDLELDGFSGQRRIEWRTDLARGRNLLALPVRSTSGTGGEIRVALRYDDQTTTELRIPVRAG